MLKITFLLSLCLIFVCYCDYNDDENPCVAEPWKVFIISNLNAQNTSNNGINEEEPTYDFIAEKLKNSIESVFINIDVTIHRAYDNDFLKMLNRHQTHMTKKGFRTITIFLDAKYFYKLNYNEILTRNFVYAGTGFKEVANFTVNKCPGKYFHHTCEIKKKKEPKRIKQGDKKKIRRKKNKKIEMTDNKTETDLTKLKCKDSHKIIPQNANCEIIEQQRVVKIVSNNSLNYLALYKFINNSGTENENLKDIKVCPEPLVIHVCGTDYGKEERNHIEYILSLHNLRIDFVTYCEDIESSYLSIAFVAPKPFNMDQDTIDVTTIFYDDHYTLPISEDSAADFFPNSFYWMPIERTMYAMVKFLEFNNWKRVAIISDELPSSKEYEQSLTSLLDQQNFIYISRSSDMLGNNLDKILSPVVASQAQFIIANVEYNTYTNFANQVKKWPHLIWLCKSPKLAKELADLGLRVFVVTMLGSTNSSQLFGHRSYSLVLDKIYSRLKNEKHRQINHSVFANQIKSQLYDAPVKIYIQKVDWQFNTHTVASMDVFSSNDIRNYQMYSESKSLERIPDELSSCTLKSNIYLKPCYDMEFIYIMLVLSVFLVLVLAIFYYFNSVEISYTRMRN